jgi:hypothetical protein
VGGRGGMSWSRPRHAKEGAKKKKIRKLRPC